MAQSQTVRAVAANLLDKYGYGIPEKEQQVAPPVRGCGRATGPPLPARGKCTAMTPGKKDKIKGGAAVTRARSGR